MIKNEVVEAFDMLIEELERIIPDLSAQGKDLMDRQEYAQARALIDKAEAVVKFKARVDALKQEWLNLQVPPIKPPQPVQAPKQPKAKKPLKHAEKGKLQEGLRTKNSDFHMPILKALAGHGGSLKFAELIKVLENDMKDVLNVHDWALLPNGITIRWVNNVGWAKTPLREAGYISATAPIGTWEITPEGRQALVEFQQKPE